ncbi:hypothetical protein CSOJ01_00064 [Colletotrichum sojae]|uniref:Uncharacterized protein n=1 Tax=Colletotrichum sojae TaxID=2175907 RepID=A0A8H6JZJ2_9PEZI|nr:hypothetical protein CSOJ01_00064 [Colletotrichum sojae]
MQSSGDCCTQDQQNVRRNGSQILGLLSGPSNNPSRCGLLSSSLQTIGSLRLHGLLFGQRPTPGVVVGRRGIAIAVAAISTHPIRCLLVCVALLGSLLWPESSAGLVSSLPSLAASGRFLSRFGQLPVRPALSSVFFASGAGNLDLDRTSPTLPPCLASHRSTKAARENHGPSTFEHQPDARGTGKANTVTMNHPEQTGNCFIPPVVVAAAAPDPAASKELANLCPEHLASAPRLPPASLSPEVCSLRLQPALHSLELETAITCISGTTFSCGSAYYTRATGPSHLETSTSIPGMQARKVHSGASVAGITPIRDGLPTSSTPYRPQLLSRTWYYKMPSLRPFSSVFTVTTSQKHSRTFANVHLEYCVGRCKKLRESGCRCGRHPSSTTQTEDGQAEDSSVIPQRARFWISHSGAANGNWLSKGAEMQPGPTRVSMADEPRAEYTTFSGIRFDMPQSLSLEAGESVCATQDDD